MKNSSSHNVIVTGAGSGLGFGIAKAFAAEGDHVFACDISAQRVDEAVDRIDGQVTGGVVDVRDYDQVLEFVKQADAADGGLHAIVNNAGIFDGYASILETSSELWDRVIDVNLKGCFNGSKAAVSVMLPRGSGRVINMSSIAAHRGGPDGLSYSASKAGIIGLTRRLAFEVAPHGLTANSISPGVIATGLRENSAEILGVTPEEMSNGYSKGLSQETLDWILPARRKGTLDEVAAAAVFLASDGAAYTTGDSILVDGGMNAV
jgi:NAD(P)-dependent dehydrogenase (short-subunit alcohol dehydrogenase family)